MTLTLTLPDEVNRRLVRAAEESGLPVEAVAANIIAEHLTPERKAAQAVALLQSWLDDPDPADQKETGDFLVKALDEDRPSDRKLFPPELEGVSW
jgi:hypothetical protein